MGATIKGLTVTLQEDVHEDKINYIITAISMIKGVVDVEAQTSNWEDQINRTRIRWEIRSKLLEFINKEFS